MKKAITLISLLFAILQGFAQNSFEKIEIEVAVPPAKAIKIANKNMAILAILLENTENETVNSINDSTSTLMLADEIKNCIESSQMASNSEIPIYKTEISGNKNIDINANLNDLNTNYGIDIAFVIKSLVIYAQTEKMFISAINETKEVTKTTYLANIQIFDTGTKTAIDSFVVRNSPVLLNAESSETVTPETIKKYVTAQIAEKFARNTLVTWEKVERICYENPLNLESRKAIKLIQDGEWEEAISCWENLLASNKKNNQAQAMYNIALSCEMLGKFDLSEKWLERCINMFGDRVDAQNYLKIIKQRIEDKNIIDNL